MIDERIVEGCKVTYINDSPRRLREKEPFIVEKIYLNPYKQKTANLKNRAADVRHGYISHTVALVECLTFYSNS